MTTITTILALIPVLLSTGRGADVMKPMAIPSVGGMLIELVSLFGIPVSYCGLLQLRWKLGLKHPFFAVDPKTVEGPPSPEDPDELPGSPFPPGPVPELSGGPGEDAPATETPETNDNEESP
jgi:hypothetical protein